ncbi:MAG: MBL fold metallo-hydrolase [Burkholderiaceae bacterium]
MHLQSIGAAGEVTGSCHLVHVGDRTILLDCGLIQGGRGADKRNREPFPFDPSRIDAVVLSHAHIDHSGRIPVLVKAGFKGPIYTQASSMELCDILLQDSAFLNEKAVQWENRKREHKGRPLLEPLFNKEDAKHAMRQFRALDYYTPTQILPGITVTLHDAGHILGSAIVELTLQEGDTTRTVVFSGDLGQSDVPILRDPTVLEHADLVLMESTYGDRLHRDREATRVEMELVMAEASKGGGNILIPAFAVGRTQLILYWMAEHYTSAGLGDWSVFLDSPLAILATEIYARHHELYDSPAAQLWKRSHGSPLLPNLHISRTTEESMAINRIHAGAIIIAGSGMCTGGRIQHHLINNVGRKNCHIVIVGYQAQGTPGRQLVDGASTIRLRGESHRVTATVHTIGGLSAHADQRGLLDWYGHFRNCPPVAVVHGDADAAAVFAGCLRKEFATTAEIMQPGERINLDGSARVRVSR